MELEMLGRAVLVTAAAGMGGTGLGGMLSCPLRRESRRMMCLLLGFAAGVMVAVVCLDLLTEALGYQGRLWPVALGVLGGHGAVAVLSAGLEAAGASERRGLAAAGAVTMGAIALHNVPEGMVIGASFAGGGAGDAGTLALAAVIGAHNIPEGMAVAAPLRGGGCSRRRTVALAALTGAPTVLGALAGFRMGALGPGGASAALSTASGAMLYVVFGELLPEAAARWSARAAALAAVLGLLTGAFIVGRG